MKTSSPLRILFVTPEVTPYARTGGLGDVTSALPRALAALGHEVQMIMPLYQQVRESQARLRHTLQDLQVTLVTGSRTATVWHDILGSKEPQEEGEVTVYFIEQDDYFARSGLYGNAQGDYPDNAERFIFFCQAVLSLLRRLGWFPHILHCHDWQTALLPAYMRFLTGLDPRFSTIASVYTIHNLAYQGVFPALVLPLTGLPASLFHPNGVEFFGNMNFMKAGLVYADALTTVSPTYAKEICTPEHGVGLEGVLQVRRHALHGILNGVDYAVWNPETDTALPERYSSADFTGKSACKTAVLRTYGLPDDKPRTLLVGMISRLVDQKGIDILTAALPDLLDLDVRLVILGSGDSRYETLLAEQALRYSDRLGVRLEFNDTLAHQIEAGCDAFLMPSHYEPCGLNQLYSMRYGTVPIVRATGGLKDSVVPFDAATGTGTGFVFQDATAEALLTAIREALRVHNEPSAWQRLMQNGMAQDYSWGQSAYQYAELYAQILATNRRA